MRSHYHEGSSPRALTQKLYGPCALTQKHGGARGMPLFSIMNRKCFSFIFYFLHQRINQSTNLTHHKNSSTAKDAWQIFCLTRDLQIQRKKLANSFSTGHLFANLLTWRYFYSISPQHLGKYPRPNSRVA